MAQGATDGVKDTHHYTIDQMMSLHIQIGVLFGYAKGFYVVFKFFVLAFKVGAAAREKCHVMIHSAGKLLQSVVGTTYVE
jgi:hypothetical protein